LAIFNVDKFIANNYLVVAFLSTNAKNSLTQSHSISYIVIYYSNDK